MKKHLLTIAFLSLALLSLVAQERKSLPVDSYEESKKEIEQEQAAEEERAEQLKQAKNFGSFRTTSTTTTTNNNGEAGDNTPVDPICSKFNECGDCIESTSGLRLAVDVCELEEDCPDEEKNCAGKCEPEPKCGCDSDGNANPDPDSQDWTPDDLKKFLEDLSPEMKDLISGLPTGTTISTQSDITSNTSVDPCGTSIDITINSSQSFINAVGSLAYEIENAVNFQMTLDAIKGVLNDPDNINSFNDFANAMYVVEAHGSLNRDLAKEQIRDTKAPCGDNQTPPSTEGSGEDPIKRAARSSQINALQQIHLKNYEALIRYTDRYGSNSVNNFFKDCK